MTFRTRSTNPSRPNPIKFYATQQTLDRAMIHIRKLGFQTLASYLTQHVKYLAEQVPEAEVPVRKRQDHWNFSNPDDARAQEDVFYAALDLLKVKPEGFRMADMWNIMEGDQHGAENPKALIIFYGRCLRNLGFVKVHVRLPTKEGEPAKYGWMYRPPEKFGPASRVG